jgi:hypothetical protein
MFRSSTGHLQVEYVYWLLPKELFFYKRSAVLVLVINCMCVYVYIYIYIYIYEYICFFSFGDFVSAISMYVVDMIAYSHSYIFQY